MIVLTIFAAILLTSSNFPTQFQCPWPMKTTTTNYSFVDCTYRMGPKSKRFVDSVFWISFVFDVAALGEFLYLLRRKNPTFRSDREFISLYLLRKRWQTIPELNQMIREDLSKNLFFLRDDFGEKFLSRREMKDIYINVRIQDGRERSTRRKFKDRHEIYAAHLERLPDARNLESTEKLFKRANADKDDPRTVLVVGRPGIGKTILTQKLFNEWLQETSGCFQTSEFWHEKIVVLIRFRDVNQSKTSLRQILSQAHGLKESLIAHFTNMTVYEYICQQPSNAILVFDGLDELGVGVKDECLTDAKAVTSPDEVNHVFLIFKQLVKGKLLPGATVLTTSRPTAEHVYEDLEFDWEVEILGFNEEQIKKYVEKFCRNDMQKSSETWNVIKDSPELLSFCYIPVNSYIVCLTLKESINFGKQVKDESYSSIPRTITEMYKRAINILLYKHNPKYKKKQVPKDYLIVKKLPKELQEDLDKLKKIAWDGMKEDKLVFEFESGGKFMAADLPDCGVFNQLEDKRQNVFSFLHLTIQEFLAALHVVDDIENVESFLCEHIHIPKWHLVIQFVSGLLGDRMRESRYASFYLQSNAGMCDVKKYAKFEEKRI